jgi:adenylate cyclase
VELAGRALGLAPQDEWAHSFMAKALSEAQRYEEAVGEAERALEINPSLSVAIARLGELYVLLGRPEQGIEKCRLALRLNPRNPTNFWRHSSIALAHFLTGDHEAMLQEARRVHSWRPDFLRGPILMAAALGALERPAEARQAVAAAQALWPALDVATVIPRFMPRIARDADHDRLLALLRTAGLPEHAQG